MSCGEMECPPQPECITTYKLYRYFDKICPFPIGFSNMQKSFLITIFSAIIMMSTHQVLAEPLTGEAEAGILLTNGNTSTQNVNLKGKLELQQTKWKHAAKAEAVNTSSNDTTTAERYLFNEKSGYLISEISDIYGSVEAEKDRFSGYDYRYTLVAGYNRKLIDHDNLTLDTGIGPGYRQRRLENNGIEKELIGQFDARLGWKISQTAIFSESLLFESGKSGSITRSLSELKLDVIGNLATKLSFRATHTSEVPVGTKKTDTETAVTLVYSF
ncbi:MAG: DUF481 domain-containing protein [Gammaproteobacteria bacterium]|nr:MAG: DUF481 domain-containing protein [Gammaproteobacteria bacterium]